MKWKLKNYNSNYLISKSKEFQESRLITKLLLNRGITTPEKVEEFLKTQNNEEQISMFGIACIKMNDLNRLATPIDKLVKSEKSRENAAYFADILFKKKLLFHAMIDGVDISYIRLPKSDYILSFLFDKFVKKEYVEELGTFIFEEPNSDTRYEISPTNGQIPKLVLKIFKNNDLKSQIEYR